MRFLMAMAASLMLMLALVGPVAATGPGCSGFGAASAAGGHREIPGFLGLPFGRFVVSEIKDGVIPGFTGVGQLVQFEHGLYCPK